MANPELLSPAGNYDALCAAVQSGADAVYLGGTVFSARAFAKNFDDDQMQRALDYCHIRGVKVHVTMNTLLLDTELQPALEYAAKLYAMGVDALIIQDAGLAALIHTQLPQLAMHASTQMAIHNLNGVSAAKELGFSRVVLAREVSKKGLSQILSATDMPIEVFVGGAMCSSVSGQCLLSSFIGGRSGNRGSCAQPCRMQYTLGGKKGYLLSMKDLCLVEQIPELSRMGVASFKIEGRMKRPEYVAAVTSVYRRAIDGELTSVEDAKTYLARAFHRGGFSQGYYYGRDDLVYTQRPGNCGVLIGKVKNGVVELKLPLKKGDELAYRKKGDDQDTTIAIDRDYPSGRARLPGLNPAKLEGISLFRTVDAELAEDTARLFKLSPRKVPVSVEVQAATGQALSVTFSAQSKTARATGPILEPAQTGEDPSDRIAVSIKKLGDTPFYPADIAVKTQGTRPFVPASLINDLRRQCAANLEAGLLDQYRRESPLVSLPAFSTKPPAQKPLLAAQVTNRAQGEKAVEAGADILYAQPRLWSEETVGVFSGFNVPVMAVLPPVLLENRLEKVLKLLDSGTFYGCVASNIGQIPYLKQKFDRIVGDYTLNITNVISAKAHIHMGLQRVALSVELTAAQIRDIIKLESCEVIVYGKLPMMNLMHCPIRERTGKCNPNCMTGAVIADRKGYQFTLLPLTLKRGECCVQLLNSLPLDGLRAFDKLMSCPPDVMRMNFYTESPSEVFQVVSAFSAALRGEEVAPFADSTGGHFLRGVKKTQEKPR